MSAMLPAAFKTELFSANLATLRERRPQLAARIEAFPNRQFLRIFKAKDGGVAYGLQEGNGVRPLTDPVAPLARLRSQLDQFTPQLMDFTRPILLLGLYPGNELISLFDLSEQDKSPHCAQPIWVCLDSPACLLGFLACWDARNLLASPRITWFWADQMPAQTDWLRKNPSFPHVFTLISGAPDSSLDAVLPPLAALVKERDQEIELLKAANNAYYDSISDQQLAAIIGNQNPEQSRSSTAAPSSNEPSHSRRPRLLMPTCSWSTFIRHSTSDTCAEFEALGWETRILEQEAMLTPYHLVKSINEFKPDVFLFIDHMRYEAEDLYPKNMMFVTWIQDDMDHLQCAEAGKKLTEYAQARKRDMVIGYTEDRLVSQFGFPAQRLAQLKIGANSKKFHPVDLTRADRAKYGCDLSFVSNACAPTEAIVKERIAPRVESFGLSLETCMKIHDELWALYRAEKTLSKPENFQAWLMQFPEYRAAYQGSENPRDETGVDELEKKQHELTRLFYWRLNDAIFRQVVLEWAAAIPAINMRLYGLGWENHPRFSRYACGPIEHGPELSKAYQAARWSLHLNITSGMHQRLWEIMASGGRPLLRKNTELKQFEPVQIALFRRLAASVVQGLDFLQAIEEGMKENSNWPIAEQEGLSDWVFNTAVWLAKKQNTDADEQPSALGAKVLESMENMIMSNPEFVIPDYDACHFITRQDFIEKLGLQEQQADDDVKS